MRFINIYLIALAAVLINANTVDDIVDAISNTDVEDDIALQIPSYLALKSSYVDNAIADDVENEDLNDVDADVDGEEADYVDTDVDAFGNGDAYVDTDADVVADNVDADVDAYVDDADNYAEENNEVDADVDAYVDDADNYAEENNEVDADSFGNGDAYVDPNEDPNIEPYVEGGDEPVEEVDDDGLVTIKVPAAYIKKYINNVDDDTEEVNDDDGIVLDFDEQKSNTGTVIAGTAGAVGAAAAAAGVFFWVKKSKKRDVEEIEQEVIKMEQMNNIRDYEEGLELGQQQSPSEKK